MDGSNLSYREYKGNVVIKIKGRGTWIIGKSLKDFINKKIREEKKIYLDLGECESLDSTILGIIAGFVIKGAPVYLFNVKSPYLLRSIRTLGLENILPVVSSLPEISPETREWKIPLLPVDRKEEMILITQAHKTLVQAVPDNLARFSDVLDLLEKEEKKELRKVTWRKR